MVRVFFAMVAFSSVVQAQTPLQIREQMLEIREQILDLRERQQQQVQRRLDQQREQVAAEAEINRRRADSLDASSAAVRQHAATVNGMLVRDAERALAVQRAQNDREIARHQQVAAEIRKRMEAESALHQLRAKEAVARNEVLYQRIMEQK